MTGGSDPGGRLFTELVAAADAVGLSLAAAESLTGGLLGYLISREPGAGEVLVGSLVTYRTTAKRELLHVPDGPVVSEGAARTMAESARTLFSADLAVSLTGVAGPAPQDGRPVGTVFIGIARTGSPSTVSGHQLDGSPDDIRMAAAREAARRMLGAIRR